MVEMVWGYRVPIEGYGSRDIPAATNEECMWVVLESKSELGFNRQVPLVTEVTYTEWRGDESERCS